MYIIDLNNIEFEIYDLESYIPGEYWTYEQLNNRWQHHRQHKLRNFGKYRNRYHTESLSSYLTGNYSFSLVPFSSLNTVNCRHIPSCLYLSNLAINNYIILITLLSFVLLCSVCKRKKIKKLEPVVKV